MSEEGLLSRLRRSHLPTFETFVEKHIGRENLRTYRTDMQMLVVLNSDRFHHWRESKRILRRQAQTGAQEARENPLSRMLFAIGATNTAVGVIVYSSGLALPPLLSLLLTLVGFVLMVLAALRRTAISFLVFDDPYRIRDVDTLKFASAWNRGVMNSWKSLLILPVVMAMAKSERGYRLGLWRIERYFS